MIVTVFGAKIFEGALTILAIPRVCHFKDMISYKKSKRKGMFFFQQKCQRMGIYALLRLFPKYSAHPRTKLGENPKAHNFFEINGLHHQKKKVMIL